MFAYLSYTRATLFVGFGNFELTAIIIIIIITTYNGHHNTAMHATTWCLIVN